MSVSYLQALTPSKWTELAATCSETSAHKIQTPGYHPIEIIQNIFFSVLYYGKAIRLQAWTGPVGSRRLRLPDFKAIGT
jgi:hypothetical protein